MRNPCPLLRHGSELRTEIALPASLLFEVEYPHILPTPPSNFSTKMGFDEGSSPLFESTPESFSKFQDSEATADKLQEQAWFFYLTDIILSRLGTRVLLNMYDTEPSGWDGTKINQLIRAANEFEHQLKDWFVIFISCRSIARPVFPASACLTRF